jgi:ceramide glucosyltransferase
LCEVYRQVPSLVLYPVLPSYNNAKVYCLQQMLHGAANDLVVMSDSDTRASPDLLRNVAAEFEDPAMGIATCPYRAIPGGSFWSRLEATGMNTDFMAGILVARMLEGMQFAVGPTIVARRSVLRSIGGFDRLKDYLAEDFVMGKFAAEAGHGVMLSSFVIEHHIGDSNMRHNAAHRLRWVRSTRRSRPLGYLGQVFTMPVPLAILVVALHLSWWPILPVALLVRAVSAWTVSVKVLRAPLPWILLPLEDITAFLFWIAGYFGNTITWRGQRYRLHADGRFELAS